MLHAGGLGSLRPLAGRAGQSKQFVVAGTCGIGGRHGFGQLGGFRLTRGGSFIGLTVSVFHRTSQRIRLFTSRIDAHRGFANAGFRLLGCFLRGLGGLRLLTQGRGRRGRRTPLIDNLDHAFFPRDQVGFCIGGSSRFFGFTSRLLRSLTSLCQELLGLLCLAQVLLTFRLGRLGGPPGFLLSLGLFSHGLGAGCFPLLGVTQRGFDALGLQTRLLGRFGFLARPFFFHHRLPLGFKPRFLKLLALTLRFDQ